MRCRWRRHLLQLCSRPRRRRRVTGMAMAVAMGDARVQGRRRRRRRRRCQPPVRQIGACAGVRLLLCWRAAIGYTYYGYTYYVPACGLDMRIESP